MLYLKLLQEKLRYELASFKFEIDSKNLEKQLEQQFEAIVTKKKCEQLREDGKMYILKKIEEDALRVIISKYDGNNALYSSGLYHEFPDIYEVLF